MKLANGRASNIRVGNDNVCARRDRNEGKEMDGWRPGSGFVSFSIPRTSGLRARGEVPRLEGTDRRLRFQRVVTRSSFPFPLLQPSIDVLPHFR